MRLVLWMICCLISVNAISQNSDTVFFYSDHDYKEEHKDSAKYFTKQFRKGDVWVRYKFVRKDKLPVICDIDENKDSSFKKLNGLHMGYILGQLTDSGCYSDGLMEGTWHFYQYSPYKVMVAKLVNDDAVQYECYDAQGNKINNDCYFQKEAEYPGGLSQWGNYLSKNINRVLNENSKALKKFSRGSYQTHIQFTVNADGSIVDTKVRKTSEHQLLDDYAIDIISNSKQWLPAVQYGRRVKAYRIQPITFKIR